MKELWNETWSSREDGETALKRAAFAVRGADYELVEMSDGRWHLAKRTDLDSSNDPPAAPKAKGPKPGRETLPKSKRKRGAPSPEVIQKVADVANLADDLNVEAMRKAAEAEPVPPPPSKKGKNGKAMKKAPVMPIAPAPKAEAKKGAAPAKKQAPPAKKPGVVPRLDEVARKGVELAKRKQGATRPDLIKLNATIGWKSYLRRYGKREGLVVNVEHENDVLVYRLVKKD